MLPSPATFTGPDAGLRTAASSPLDRVVGVDELEERVESELNGDDRLTQIPGERRIDPWSRVWAGTAAS